MAVDLHPYKSKLMELSYEDKMKISEWLRDQIDLERGQVVKEKLEQTNQKIDNFVQKASDMTQKSTNSAISAFKNAFGFNDPGKSTTSQGPEKR